MERLREKLDLPRGHYYLHVAVLAGLPVSLISDLASELERSPAQIAQWITHQLMHSLHRFSPDLVVADDLDRQL